MTFWHPFADMGAVRDAELELVRGEDVWVFDAAGTRYLDATASLWYCNVGHGRPEIAAAVAAQLGRLEAYSAFGDLTSPPARELTARLAGHAPMDDAKVFLGSGGGDGIEIAAKLARRFFVETGDPGRAHSWSARRATTARTGSGPRWPGSRPTAPRGARWSRTSAWSPTTPWTSCAPCWSPSASRPCSWSR